MDRLSELPESVLIHILSLSFPDVRRASITSVLSKRWRFLWAELPRLEFQGTHVNTDEKRAIFVALINRALATRAAKCVEKLHVSLEYDNSLASDVDAWVEYAVRNKVKEFSLGLSKRKYLYMVPQMLYSTSSLTNLLLRHCIMPPLETINWKSLTKLEIVEAKLDQLVVEKILSGCPVLHNLNLIRCWGFNCLEVNSPSLYKLWIMESDYGNEALLEISAPYLHSLSISFYHHGRKLVLQNIPSLVCASIDFVGNDRGYDWNNMKELVERTRHVKELELGNMYFNVVSMLAVSGWQLPRSRLVSLRLTTDRAYEHNITGIVSLLESSPMLETLVIRGRTCSNEVGSGDSGAMVDLDGDLMHLKRVKLDSFASPMLTIARILLERATILEEMIILDDFKDTNLREKGTQLLTYPRSSHKALVQLQFY